MKAVLASALVLALTLTSTVSARPQLSPDVWRTVAEKLPIGSVVKIRTTSRERLTAVLFVVDDTGITVKPKTRIPEPARRVPYDRIEDLQLDRGTRGFGKAVGIGAGVGAGVFGLVILMLTHLD
jgi:hypothetical protein